MQDLPEWLRTALSQPTMSVPAAGRAVADLSRNGSYLAAARGDFPTIIVGSRIRVPTAWVRRKLQLDPPAQLELDLPLPTSSGGEVRR